MQPGESAQWGAERRETCAAELRKAGIPPVVHKLRAWDKVRPRLNLNSEIELRIMRHFLLAGQISEKLAEATVRGW